MAQVNFLFLRLLVSETQTDRQTDRQGKFVIDIYVPISVNDFLQVKILEGLAKWPYPLRPIGHGI